MRIAISMRLVALGFILAMAGFVAVSAHAADTIISDIDLSGPFSTQAPWRFTASQGPSVDIVDFGPMPGEVRICLRKASSDQCDPQLQILQDKEGSFYSQPHYLKKAKVVQDANGRAFFWVRTASMPSTNGNENVYTQILSYRREADAFVRVYDYLTGRNNNEEVRFIEDGALKGRVVSVEPTDDAPFGYWVSVNAAGPDGTYKEILRYRSATIYGDDNPLAVIDSEMPNMQQRLGLWEPGTPLPLPAKGCAKPRLIKMALWCD